MKVLVNFCRSRRKLVTDENSISHTNRKHKKNEYFVRSRTYKCGCVDVWVGGWVGGCASVYRVINYLRVAKHFKRLASSRGGGEILLKTKFRFGHEKTRAYCDELSRSEGKHDRGRGHVFNTTGVNFITKIRLERPEVCEI